MTIGEAHAVNVLLAFLLHEENEIPLGREPKPVLREVEDAGAELAKKAHKALLAGYNEDDWRQKWRRRTKR